MLLKKATTTLVANTPDITTIVEEVAAEDGFTYDFDTFTAEVIDRDLVNETNFATILAFASVVSTASVARLAKCGFDINATTTLDTYEREGVKLRTALMHSCMKGHQSAVEALLATGANPNAQDEDGDTPLHEAIKGCDWRIAEALLKHGAKINLANKAGITAEALAATAGNDEFKDAREAIRRALRNAKSSQSQRAVCG